MTWKWLDANGSGLLQDHRTMRTTPSDVLRDLMDWYSLSCSELARHMRVPANRVTQVVRGTRRITPDTALRLERVFPDEDITAMQWLELQVEADLVAARSRSYVVDPVRQGEIIMHDDGFEHVRVNRRGQPVSSDQKKTGS